MYLEFFSEGFEDYILKKMLPPAESAILALRGQTSWA